MSTYILSPNMSLPVPDIGLAPGPDWAADLNASLGTLDGHTHSPGSGVQIQPSGININTDLPFGSNNATLLRSSRYVNQTATLALATDLCCVYASGGNLYYNNSSGTGVQITSGSSVNAGAGSITGLPSGTASVTFSSGIYVFQSATNTPASIDVGSVILRNTAAASNGVTLSPVNALSTNYSLILPLIPAQTLILALDTSGNITASVNADNSTLQFSGTVLSVKNLGITAAQIANATITQAKLANNSVGTAQIIDGNVTLVKLVAPNIGIDSSFAITKTTSGRLMQLALISTGTAADAYIQMTTTGGAGTIMSFRVSFAVNGSTVSRQIYQVISAAAGNQWRVPPSMFTFYTTAASTPGSNSFGATVEPIEVATTVTTPNTTFYVQEF